MESYTPGQRDAVVEAASPTWARLCIQILVGTGDADLRALRDPAR
jgi:hypothetical protein